MLPNTDPYRWVPETTPEESRRREIKALHRRMWALLNEAIELENRAVRLEHRS